MDMTTTTDLAARFEAKREECEAVVQKWIGQNEVVEAVWRNRASAFAEARDMARAGAAGGDWVVEVRPDLGAPSREPNVHDIVLAYYHRWISDGRKADDLTEQYCAALRNAVRAAPPPPAQQGSSPPPLTAERVDLGELADGYVQRVAEWDDRTSQEDWPEAMLITGEELKRELLQFVADAGHLVPASLPGGTGSADGGTGETLQTIAQWCEKTFGPVTPERVAKRAAEEMDELLAEPTKVEEAADVVIVLSRYAGLWEAVERKMAVNRARKWRLMGDGTGYHVNTPAPCDGSPEGDSAVTEGQAPQPDPVGEAKALLEGLPEGVTTKVVYLALDNSEHRNAKGAAEKNASIDRTERANAMLEAGATVYDAARVWSWIKDPTLPDVLRKITKDTPLIISHWQCRDNPGYTVCRFETDDYYVYVGGDAGSWSGSYGSKITLAELARYAEDTLEKHPALATLHASQDQAGEVRDV